MVGAETAEFLAEKGHDVSIIEMRDAIGPDVIHEHRVFLMEGLKEYDVHQYVDAAVSEIYPDGVSYKNAADKSAIIHSSNFKYWESYRVSGQWYFTDWRHFL